ncbi:MAG: hypothetical protein ACK4XH_20590 [Microcystis sp.]|uniref:hypothetical protein n=1 Tax=Microcystis sp. TaxID=1127 RepID=UPI00391901E6
MTIVANDLDAAVPRQIGVLTQIFNKLIIAHDEMWSFFPSKNGESPWSYSPPEIE